MERSLISITVKIVVQEVL